MSHDYISTLTCTAGHIRIRKTTYSHLYLKHRVKLATVPQTDAGYFSITLGPCGPGNEIV